MADAPQPQPQPQPQERPRSGGDGDGDATAGDPDDVYARPPLRSADGEAPMPADYYRAGAGADAGAHGDGELDAGADAEGTALPGQPWRPPASWDTLAASTDAARPASRPPARILVPRDWSEGELCRFALTMPDALEGHVRPRRPQHAPSWPDGVLS